MTHLTLSFFNSFEVSVQGNRIGSFRSAKVQGLLVYLVLEVETAHPRDKLATIFWPDDPQATARKNLRQSLYQLRKLIGDTDNYGQPLLDVTRQTIQFNAESDTELDVALFQAALERGDLDLAETYYVGSLLPAFSCDSQPFDDWVSRKRNAYQQAALDVMHTLAERQLELGRAAISRALALARRQLDLEPWREEAHRQLMRGLALSGDRSGAIAQFDICSDVLADELGVSPAAETFALFEAIRDGAFPPVSEKAATKMPNNIPHQATQLVGRSAEIDQLLTHLRDPHTHLITIVGPGGMGKTRLSLETARQLLDSDGANRFPDGLFLVELATATTREEMLSACASAFGFALESEPQPLQQIVSFLGNKEVLLLLDNVEQLIAPPARAADLVAALLSGAPRLKVLVTSRQKLNLSSEHVLPLAGLALPERGPGAVAPTSDAVQLFAQSARRVQPTFQLTDYNAPHVARICRLAGGMPLGILLSAAWSHLLQPAEIVAEMQADVDFIAVEMPDLPARQRSMRAVFDHSWALLSQSEQQVLAKLSVFQGGFTREAARVVTGATLPILLGLVNKSLLQRNVERGRFNMHELVRQLAVEKLAETDTIADIQRAHSRYFLSLFETHGLLLAGPSQREAAAALLGNAQNIRAAWLWAAEHNDTATMIPVVGRLYYSFVHTGRDYELKELWRATLERLPPGDPSFADRDDETTFLRAVLLNRLQERGHVEAVTGAPLDLDRMAAYFEARGSLLEQGLMCQHLGFRAIDRGEFDAAVAYWQQLLELYSAAGATYRLPNGMVVMSNMAFRAGRMADGLALAQRALALAEANHDRYNKPTALTLLGVHSLGANGVTDEAEQLFAQVTAIGSVLFEDRLTAAVATLGLSFQAYCALLRGDAAAAQQYADRLTALVAARNNARDKVDAFMTQALIDATRGHYHDIDHMEVMQGTAGHYIQARLALMLHACGAGRLQGAQALLVGELSSPTVAHWPAFVLNGFPVAAALLLEKGNPARAAELLALGRAHPACPAGWWGIMDLVQTLDARLQAELSLETYAEAQARGQKMDVEATAKALLQELMAVSSVDADQTE